MCAMETKKQKLREQIVQLRDALDSHQHTAKSHTACQHVLNQPFFNRDHGKLPPTIAMYMPFRSELDITPIMKWCWERQWNILVPRINRGQSSFRLHYIASDDDLERGTWGIMEPKVHLPHWEQNVSIDIVFVPGIAFDRSGGRLGFGGGYYDRFVTSYNNLALSKPILISVAFDLQMVDTVPVEIHDLLVDQVITESGPQIFKNNS